MVNGDFTPPAAVLRRDVGRYRSQFTFTREGDRLTMERRVNINSAARAWPVVTATRA